MFSMSRGKLLVKSKLLMKSCREARNSQDLIIALPIAQTQLCNTVQDAWSCTEFRNRLWMRILVLKLGGVTPKCGDFLAQSVITYLNPRFFPLLGLKVVVLVPLKTTLFAVSWKIWVHWTSACPTAAWLALRELSPQKPKPHMQRCDWLNMRPHQPRHTLSQTQRMNFWLGVLPKEVSLQVSN